MAISNKKYRQIVRIVEFYFPESSARSQCMQAIAETLKPELDLYNKGLEKLNTRNRVTREEREFVQLQMQAQKNGAQEQQKNLPSGTEDA